MSDQKDKTISILGTGWLGLPLARHLADLGFTVKASTRSSHRLAEIAANHIEPFIINIDNKLNEIAPFLATDILIINITSKNIASFNDLVKQIKQSMVKNVLFVSSTSVYANTNKVVTENDDLMPDHPLLQIENLFRANQQFDTTIVRFSGLIGGSRHPGRFFRNGKVIQEADAPVNLIHRDDCIGIISAIIEHQAWGEVFNACADTHPTKRVFYSFARTILNQALPEFADTSKPHYKIVSNEKIKRLLGYDFVHPDVMKIAYEK